MVTVSRLVIRVENTATTSNLVRGFRSGPERHYSPFSPISILNMLSWGLRFPPRLSIFQGSAEKHAYCNRKRRPLTCTRNLFWPNYNGNPLLKVLSTLVRVKVNHSNSKNKLYSKFLMPISMHGLKECLHATPARHFHFPWTLLVHHLPRHNLISMCLGQGSKYCRC